MKKDDDSYQRFSSNSNNDYSLVGSGDVIFETNVQLESYLSTPVKKEKYSK